jgi:polyisoprenoid-binding protein YceI
MKPLLCGAAAMMLAAGAFADTVTYKALPRGSSMKIDGTSTIHDWTVESLVIGGSMELDSNFPIDPSKDVPKDLKLTPKVDVFIPVRQLKSNHSTMDTVMHNDMNAETHPRIEYKVLEMTPKGKEGNGIKFGTKGTITCNGVTTTNDFDVIITKVDDKKLKVSGTTKVKMTDYKIQPPAPKIALGAIKTGDDVKLTWEWLTQEKAKE